MALHTVAAIAVNISVTMTPLLTAALLRSSVPRLLRGWIQFKMSLHDQTNFATSSHCGYVGLVRLCLQSGYYGSDHTSVQRMLPAVCAVIQQVNQVRASARTQAPTGAPSALCPAPAAALLRHWLGPPSPGCSPPSDHSIRPSSRQNSSFPVGLPPSPHKGGGGGDQLQFYLFQKSAVPVTHCDHKAEGGRRAVFLLTLGDVGLYKDDEWFELCRTESFQHLSEEVKLNGFKSIRL